MFGKKQKKPELDPAERKRISKLPPYEALRELERLQRTPKPPFNFNEWWEWHTWRDWGEPGEGMIEYWMEM